MQVELANCERVLLEEIAGKATRLDVAKTYALALRSSERANGQIDWAKVNKAIIRKWCSNALQWIKEQAHSGKCFEEGQQ